MSDRVLDDLRQTNYLPECAEVNLAEPQRVLVAKTGKNPLLMAKWLKTIIVGFCNY